ncbi:MAG TPA: 50S ribosomal protein L9 [Proteobacteria bacterium]|nr:50S ribosomal protein L9 [bacterium BMS3Abin14]HDL53255.1 50S ribosomal protein L9 [Pseudomonadota bacterium]
MKIILLEDVSSLGKMGDTVEVRQGYARNYLFPRELAVQATSRNIKSQEHQLHALRRKVEKTRIDAQSFAEKLSEVSLTLTRKAGDGGRLFGSVTNMDIGEALAAEGIDIDRRNILLEDNIKELGEFEVPIKLHQDVSATVKVAVVEEAKSDAQ